MDDRVTISFTGSDPNRRRPTADDATAFRIDGGEGTGWRPLESQAEGGLGRRYLIGRELGRGGMGIVSEGWDPHLQRSVAIKIMDRGLQARPSALQRFFREARIASRLGHPGIVTIHEFDVTPEGEAFIVMQLLTGRTLKRVLAEIPDRAADLPALLAVFLQVCQAVASAHGAGVIHRDLKPSNIMVASFGVVTVMDWGVAKVIAEPEDLVDDMAATVPVGLATAETTQSQSTMAGTVFGTPAYLAPEQARGEVSRLDCRADVFGLGSILCEILTGAATFTDADVDSRWKKAAAGDTAEALERLDACGAPLPVVALAKRCLAVDPDQRPATAADVATTLTEFLESGQRRAEQELVRFFDLSVDLFCIAGFNGRFHRLNDNFSRRLGYSVDDLEAHQFIDLVHLDDRERTVMALAGLAAGTPVSQFVNRYRHADGGYLWLEWNARPVPEEAAVYAVARDVSDRVAAAELRSRMEQERSTLAAFAAAAGLFLTAPGSLSERMQDVVEEGVAQLGVMAMEVWALAAETGRLALLAAAGPEIEPRRRQDGVAVGERLVGTIARDLQPRQIVAGSEAWRTIDATSLESLGIGSFVGYPLLVAGRPVGVLAVYAEGPVSDLLVTAMSATLASLALAIAAANDSV